MLAVLVGKVQRVSKDTKQSYFNKTWNAAAGFDKNVDRKDYTFEDVADCSPERQLARTIIERCQMKSDDELNHFVDHLTEKSLSFVARRKGILLQEAQRASMIGQSAVDVIDRMFLTLFQCARQLNSSLGLPGLMIDYTAPEYVTEIVRFSRMRQPLESVVFYRARVTSPTWSLVMRSQNDVIELFLLPTRSVMGLSRAEREYSPTAVLRATIEEEGVVWEIDGKVVNETRLREICMIHFKQLLDRSIEEIVIEDDAEFYPHSA